MPRPPRIKAPNISAPLSLKVEGPEAQEMRRTLAGFYGTSQWYSLAPISRLTFTDGVKYLADAGKANWLVTDIAAIVEAEPNVSKAYKRGSVYAEVKVFADKTATVTYLSEGQKKLYEQKYSYTDFPLNNVKIKIANGVMCLPGED